MTSAAPARAASGGETVDAGAPVEATADLRHPLLDKAAAARAWTDSSLSAEDLYRDLHVFDAVQVDADGVETVVSSFERRTVELDDTAGDTAGDTAVASATTGAVDLILDEQVEAWLDTPPDGDKLLDLWIGLDRVSWNPVVSLEHELAIAMLEGRVASEGDVFDVKTTARDTREAAGEEFLAPLLAWLEEHGAEQVQVMPRVAAVRVLLPAVYLEEVVALDGVQRVETPAEPQDDYGHTTTVEDPPAIDNFELIDLLQNWVFYMSGTIGGGGYQGDETIGMTETYADDAFRHHPGFDDQYGVDRYTNCPVPWGGDSCSSNPDPTYGADHATATASILIGDITQDQDSAYYSCTPTLPPNLQPRDCHERSGVARRATALGVRNNYSSRVARTLTNPIYDIKLVNQSSSGDNDPKCKGQTHWSTVWNSMYEDGLALINSAGNNGHSDPDDCTVGPPATAIGVFTVGAYNVLDLPPGSLDPPTEVTVSMARGGTSTEGRNRTIVDIAAPSQLWWAYPAPMTALVRYGADWDVGGGPLGDGVPDGFCCTSAATPTVTGSAALFRQFYLDNYSTLIDSPGILYANLLLMGDRREESGGRLTTGYDSLWGAGHLHMRMWSNEAMDVPWRWGTGHVCVGQGEIVTIALSDGVVPQDVDIVKAVAWWYDHRHDSGTDHDVVKLTIEKNSGSSTERISDTVGDNKQRAVDFDPAGWELELELKGNNVTSDAEGCGTDSTRVYYAYYWEDLDRDDPGKPLLDYVRDE